MLGGIVRGTAAARQAARPPGLAAAAPESPVVDVLVVIALVAALMAAGTWAFDRRERSR